MLRQIALFELRQQLGGHVFWVVFAISLTMVLGSVGVDALRVGPHHAGLRNGAELIVQTHLVWTLFFMFTTAAFVADAVLRDELLGFAPILHATPVRWRDLVYGRFAGAFVAVLLCFSSVPVGIVAGSAMPWVEPGTVGRTPAGAFAFAFFVMAVPNLLLSTSLGFALATLGRTLAAALIGAVLLLTLYGLGARTGASLPPSIEPFGFAAYAEATAGWSRALRDVAVPALGGTLLANRALVLAASTALLAAAALRRAQPQMPPPKAEPASISAPPAVALGRPDIAPKAPSFSLQFAVRLRLEVAQVVRTPVFVVLLVLGIANAAAALWPVRSTADPQLAVRTVSDAFQLAPIVVALFFTGELRWVERERRIAPLLVATPMVPAAFLLPKFAAVAIVLVSTIVLAALTAGVVMGSGGGFAAAALLPVWCAVACYDALVFAALAMFFQAVAPDKLSGWGFTILFLVASLALDRLGFIDPVYRYARYPGWPLPSAVSNEPLAWRYQLYWAGIALLLLTIAVRIAGPAGLARARWPRSTRR
jgi:ABC-type transport system involved in multi-copper enzyme maturation permease subunit